MFQLDLQIWARPHGHGKQTSKIGEEIVWFASM